MNEAYKKQLNGEITDEVKSKIVSGLYFEQATGNLKHVLDKLNKEELAKAFSIVQNMLTSMLQQLDNENTWRDKRMASEYILSITNLLTSIAKRLEEIEEEE